ncbi:MAG TPA: Uma2 family endonuclease [Pirellulales bacterium]|nr:Uma2 family endonuclease [Pirellulales bacterium]
MATAERPAPEQRIVMHGISWRTYEKLLEERGERTVPRMCYNQGSLEMMSPSKEHEKYRRLIGRLIDEWTVANGIEIASAGATTLKREVSQRGAEADECFYIRDERLMRGRRKIDLNVDPPPDLAFEIDISSSSIDKLVVYAALGVREVWLFNGETLTIYELQSDGRYHAIEKSVLLPGFPVKDVPEWISRASTTGETKWTGAFRDWVRTRSEPGGD